MSKNLVKKVTKINIRPNKATSSEQLSILDSLDKKLLNLMMADCRTSYREIARHLRLSVGTIIERMRRMEIERVVKGYSVMVDAEKVGYGITAVIEIFASRKSVGELEMTIAKFPNVCAVYTVSGRADNIIIGKFRDMEDLSNFIRALLRLKNVARTETLLVFNTYKEDFRPHV